MKGSRRRKLYHDPGIFTAEPEVIEKSAQSWRVSARLFAYAHEPAKRYAGKTKQKPNPRKKNLCKPDN
jgi:hypothetical protein